MRHLIDRVLELSEEEQVRITPSDIPPGQGNEEELKALAVKYSLPLDEAREQLERLKK